MENIRNLVNELYDNIGLHIRQPILDAINAADESDEDNVIIPLVTMVTLIGNNFDVSLAVNGYMTDPATRWSVTRRFFYDHTLSGNFYPEDRNNYVLPMPPGPIPVLRAHNTL